MKVNYDFKCPNCKERLVHNASKFQKVIEKQILAKGTIAFVCGHCKNLLHIISDSKSVD